MPLSRKKACVRCRRSKLSCNRTTPSCARCSTSGSSCEYEGEARLAPYPADFGSTMRFDDDTQALQSLDWTDDIDVYGPSSTSNMLETLPDWSSPSGGTSLPWDSTPKSTLPAFALGVDSAKELHILPRVGNTPSLTPPPPPTASSTLAEIPGTRGPLGKRRLLVHCVLTNILVGQLTSYPKLMFEGNTLPPFICPPCHVREDLAVDCHEAGHHRCLPEDLAICADLVRMFYERSTWKKDFVWGTIYAESNRYHREVSRTLLICPLVRMIDCRHSIMRMMPTAS